MFCPNCGNNCGDAKFCPECGTKLDVQNAVPADTAKKAAPKSVYQPVNVDGKEVDLFKVVCKFGANKERAYSYLKREYGIPKDRAKVLLDPYYTPKEASKQTIKESFAELAQNAVNEKNAVVARRNSLEESGQVYCPKCLSTSVSANQKGFGFARGAIGAAVGLDVGLIAGGIGSKKVICTCLKCGHQWKPGKK